MWKWEQFRIVKCIGLFLSWAKIYPLSECLWPKSTSTSNPLLLDPKEIEIVLKSLNCTMAFGIVIEKCQSIWAASFWPRRWDSNACNYSFIVKLSLGIMSKVVACELLCPLSRVRVPASVGKRLRRTKRSCFKVTHLVLLITISTYRYKTIDNHDTKIDVLRSI